MTALADLRDVRRWGKIGLGAALRPLLYQFAGLAFGNAMVASALINRRRDRRRCQTLARTLGIDQGRVLSWTYTEDATAPRQKLQVTSLRRLLAGRSCGSDRARPEGETIPSLDVVVPEGKTGMWISVA